jgi:hypothetical protein
MGVGETMIDMETIAIMRDKDQNENQGYYARPVTN